MEDVIMETSMGTIVCEMYYDHAPRTCKNFVELVDVGNLTQANNAVQTWILQWSNSKFAL